MHGSLYWGFVVSILCVENSKRVVKKRLDCMVIYLSDSFRATSQDKQKWSTFSDVVEHVLFKKYNKSACAHNFTLCVTCSEFLHSPAIAQSIKCIKFCLWPLKNATVQTNVPRKRSINFLWKLFVWVNVGQYLSPSG